MLKWWRSSLTLLVAFVLLALPLGCATPSSVVPTQPPATPTKPAAATQPPSQATPAPTQATAKKGGTFIDVSFADAVTMQPVLTQDTASRNRVNLVYPPLLTYNKSLELVGDLAKSFKVSDDKLSITVELRENAAWSDGTPVSADDVKFTFDKMMDEKTKFPYRSLWTSFTGVEVTGPKTVVFKLKEIFAPALGQLAGFAPIPKHIFEKVADINENELNNKPPVSAGPFLFKEWVKDDHATFTANDKYYGGRPNLDTYIFRVVKDQTVAYSMLKTAEVDGLERVLPQDYDDAKTSTVFDTYRYYNFAAAWDFIGFNLKNPILADKKVRLALSHGLDRAKVIERVLLGFAKPQNSIFPSTSPAFTDDVPKFEYDVAKAKALLDEAGWKPGSDGIRVKDGQKLKLRIHFNAGNKRREMISTIAQQYWKEIGVEIEVGQDEWGAFLKRFLETKDFDLLVLGFSGGFEPNDAVNIWGTGKGQNIGGYSNPKVDDLFKQAVTVSYDMKERKKIYAEIQKLVAEDQPYIFLFTQEDILGVNKRIKGVSPDPLGLRWNVQSWNSITGQ